MYYPILPLLTNTNTYIHVRTVSGLGLSLVLDISGEVNPLKGRDVNWLHLAIQV